MTSRGMVAPSSEAFESLAMHGLNPRHIPAYAILRIDTGARKGSPFSRVVTVKKVVLTEAYAKSEAERLNTMNAGKGCQYVVQLTELDESELPAFG